MGGTEYAVDGSRIGLDQAGAIAWQEACDTVVTGWDIADQAIVAITAQCGAHTPPGESFKIRWRNKTDSPAGAFADLVTGSGEIRVGASAGCITDTDPVGAECGCEAVQITDSEECETASPAQTGTLTVAAKLDSVEVQVCVDFTNAHVKYYKNNVYIGASVS